VVSSLLAAAVVMTAGFAVFFDARARAVENERTAASFEFLKAELQLFSFAVDLADDTAAATLFGTGPDMFTFESGRRFTSLMASLVVLARREDTVGTLSSQLQAAIALEQTNVVGTTDIADFSGAFVLDYYDTAISIWAEFEPITRSLVGDDRIDLVIGSQVLFETRRIRRASLRNQARNSGLSPADPVYTYLMGSDRLASADDPIGPRGQFQLGLRPLLEAAGVDTAVLGDRTVEQGFAAADISRKENLYTPERDELLVLAMQRIDGAFYAVLDTEASQLLLNAERSQRVANVALAFVLAVGIGLVALVRYMIRISTREGEALASRERVISRQEEFIGLVSHELRTPITSILGYSEVLNGHLDEFPSEEIDEMIGIIADQSNHVSTLVDDLLTLFRADAGQLRLSVSDFSIRDVIDEVLLMVPPTVSENVTVTYDIHASARADRSRVFQIIRNVVDNAGKYGGDEISIHAKAVATGVVVRIGDDGPGIPEAAVERVFEPFGQLDEHGRQGSGLGLAIAARLADAMGGSLHYESRHAGALFVLELRAGNAPDSRPTVSSLVADGFYRAH
jgi:signal transduction histidine kinase